jgi:hypothetical protein
MIDQNCRLMNLAADGAATGQRARLAGYLSAHPSSPY